MSDITESSLLIVGDGGRRPRGRPRSPEPKSSVSFRTSTRNHDVLIQLANRGDKSVSKLLSDIVDQLVERRR